MARTDNIKRRQRRAILTLLSEPTIKGAAKAAKIGEKTLHRWLAEDEEFKAELAEAEAQALGQTARVMGANADIAVSSLLLVLADPGATNSEKTQAARAYLASLPPIRLLGSIEARLAELLGEN
jgi:hypothetical protein